jgi:hypothetical protein
VTDQEEHTAWHDARPTWDLYRKMQDSPHVSLARRQVALWALDQLEGCMGPDWLERYYRTSGHVPTEINLGGAHVAAFGNLLDLALRLAILDRVPGAGKVRKETRTDLRDDRRRHSALQLEVGGLAAREGYTVAFEDRLDPGAPPSDVVLRRGEQTIRLETFAILRDRRSQDAARYWDRISQAILRIGWKHDTPISGSITRQLDEQETTELLDALEQAAQETAATHQPREISRPGANLLAQSPGDSRHKLEFGIEETKSWPRVESKLRQKAEQAQAAGGGWLRADLLDGTWAFTPWAKAGLQAKITEMAKLVRPLLNHYPAISGLVLSNGASVAHGQFVGESAPSSNESYGLRRVLPAVRVRETMIIPSNADGLKQARQWVGIYNAEDTWLDWALKRHGLPPWSEIRP